MAEELDVKIFRTNEFDSWLSGLRDERAIRAIVGRLDRIAAIGRVVGDVHPIGNGVSEMRFNVGPGYRVYFAQRGNVMVLLLVGGSKRRQEHDIRHAIDMLKELKGANQW